jgi:hypothetical protein
MTGRWDAAVELQHGRCPGGAATTLRARNGPSRQLAAERARNGERNRGAAARSGLAAAVGDNL